MGLFGGGVGDAGGTRIEILKPTPVNLARAAAALRSGELVGMPTETVYGIAASAYDPEAVRRTFLLKGRPADNPLIVHIAHLSQLEGVAREWPETAQRLADQFWPGPVTIVVSRSPKVPEIVSAGRSTVAIRMPAHPAAQRLIDALGTPVTAPSANVFMGLSPTRSSDIAPEIAAGLAVILDGGDCEIGVESTVVDCSDGGATVLRPGSVSRTLIEAAIGHPLGEATYGERRSPGMYRRHYAPRTPVRLVDHLDAGAAGLTFSAPTGPQQIQLPTNPIAYATRLYAALHELDAGGYGRLEIERPPETPEWEAVWDRLLKAAEPE